MSENVDTGLNEDGELLAQFARYCFSQCHAPTKSFLLAEGYGTEVFCWFLYSLVRMDMPRTVVEIGAGAGVTSIASGLALRINGDGTLWSVDNGEDWHILRPGCQAALSYELESETYIDFRERLHTYFKVTDIVRSIDVTLGPDTFFSPSESIDLLFVDAGDSGPVGCLDLLRYYLPRMSARSSLILDKSSTIWDASLLLENVVEHLNNGKLPAALVNGMSSIDMSRLKALNNRSFITMVHLVDRNPAKLHKAQNSRCWLRIHPNDVVADDTVAIAGYGDADLSWRSARIGDPQAPNRT
jgi:hypothetical protein